LFRARIAIFGHRLEYIHFDLIMGISASLPTCIHVYMFFRSGWNNLVPERN